MTNAEALAIIVTNFGGTVDGNESIADLLAMLSELAGDSSVVTSAYELPIAKADTLGGVKVGSNLSINATTGVLSATDTTYGAATADTLGLVKIGEGLTITDGVLSVTQG